VITQKKVKGILMRELWQLSEKIIEFVTKVRLQFLCGILTPFIWTWNVFTIENSVAMFRGSAEGA
jgi:hypothetical protein